MLTIGPRALTDPLPVYVLVNEHARWERLSGGAFQLYDAWGYFIEDGPLTFPEDGDCLGALARNLLRRGYEILSLREVDDLPLPPSNI